MNSKCNRMIWKIVKWWVEKHLEKMRLVVQPPSPSKMSLLIIHSKFDIFLTSPPFLHNVIYFAHFIGLPLVTKINFHFFGELVPFTYYTTLLWLSKKLYHSSLEGNAMAVFDSICLKIEDISRSMQNQWFELPWPS